MPLAMKFQINNGGYLQLRSFTSFALHDLYSSPFWTLLAGGFLCCIDLVSNGPNKNQCLAELPCPANPFIALAVYWSIPTTLQLLNISIKDRQIGGSQRERFALHKRFSIAVGWGLHDANWFHKSRDFLKGSGSSDVCQVSVGPTRASPRHPSLDCWMLALGCQHYDLTFKCQLIFQWLKIFGNV